MKSLLVGLLAFVAFACEDDYAETLMREQNIVQIVGRVTEYNDHTVTSRALKSEEESEIKTMSMFLFDDHEICVDFQHVSSSSPLFVIDRTILNAESDDKDVSEATLYILANVPMTTSSLEEELVYWLGKEIGELEARSLEVVGIDNPVNGFPMVGKVTANLELDGDAKDLLEIPLKHLYAKMVFNVKVNTTQTLEEFIPSFQMTGWEVYNVPGQVLLNDNAPSESTVYLSEAIQKRNYTGSNPVSGSNTLSFSFYLPEHMLQSDKTVIYPEGIEDNEKQRFKPLRIQETTKAPYVKIKGTFSDHQGHRHNLSYDIYLGKNNWENFEIERNYQYNNNVTISGITNHITGNEGSISVDHRVNVEQSNYVIAMERETMLDSHIEVRPLRLNITEKSGIDQQVKIYLANPSLPSEPISSTDSNYEWVRLEVANSALNETDYCDNGCRKYFTTDLLSELNTGSGNGISASLTSDSCIWVYFDENINVSKTGTRKILLVAEYYENNALISSESYYFQQHDLFPVIYTDNEAGFEYRYDIEYYEEYLYNYDSDNEYNETTEGMIWGPNKQISDEILAIQDVKNWWTDNLQYIENAIKRAGGYYDFQDLFTGRVYTKKLVEKMEQLVMSQNNLPKSAAEHCYNKNKRQKEDGTIKAEDYKWYLPAIGELQRIMSAAYIDFEMFQENKYWSSQTSYRIGHFNYALLWGILGDIEGDYYYEDESYARATHAAYSNGVYTYEPSEIDGISKTWNGSITNTTGRFTDEKEPTIRDSGNRLRDKIHRVRAVRNKYQRPIGTTVWTEINE